MTTLYLDCFSGAAGDMLLGALVDAGASVEEITSQLGTLDIEGWELRADTVTKGVLRATKIDVVLDYPSPLRYPYIVELIASAPLPERAQRRALDAFRLLGEAEARAHGVELDELRLHETGALDAIVDIVGSCLALELLGVDRVVASAVTTGRGFAESSHGRIPVPAPAVTAIAAKVGMRLVERGDQELVTPTGAALLGAVCDSFGDMPEMRVEGVGYGAGTKDLEVPNVVRALLGTEESSPPASDLVMIETNIDDSTPEIVAYAIEKILGAGALDAWVQPITMKKGRPGFLLSALTATEHRGGVLDVIFKETTTFGIRVGSVEREVLDRRSVEVDVAGLSVRVKIGSRHGEVVTISPEFEDARTVAEATGLPLKEVYARATEAARAILS